MFMLRTATWVWAVSTASSDVGSGDSELLRALLLRRPRCAATRAPGALGARRGAPACRPLRGAPPDGVPVTAAAG